MAPTRCVLPLCSSVRKDLWTSARFSKLRKFFKSGKAAEEPGRGRGRGWRNWRLPCCKNRVHPVVDSVARVIQVLPPAAVDSAARGERMSTGTSKSSATTRRSLATLGQAVEPPTCPESLATEVLTRRSLASLGHSLGENICPEDAAELLETIVPQEGLAKQDGPSEEAQCGFLSMILTACLKAIVKGEDVLDLPQSKADLVAEVVAILEQVVADHTPGNILPCALVALHHLSKMKPRTPWELEDRFLNLALHAVLRLEEPCFDYVGQSLYRSSHQTLEVLLLGLLQEDSSSEHLFAILDHLQTGLRSQEDRERIWASGKITGLLRRAALLREYNIMGEGLGRYVAELGVLLMDPKRQVVRHAREGIYRLYELGLQQRGIDIRDVESLWLQDPTLDWEMACYLNTVRMAKKLDDILSAEQRLAFLKTTLQAVMDPVPYISQPALFLLYSFLGLGKELLGMDAQGTEAKVERHLRRFRECGKQPIELRCLLAEKDEVLLDDLEEEEETEEEEEEEAQG